MKFDGKTYLATCIRLQLDSYVKGNNCSEFTTADYVGKLYGGKELNIPFGSIAYNVEKEEADDIDLEYIEFCPSNRQNINIDRIEIGNRFGFYGYAPRVENNMLVSASFDHGAVTVKSLLDLSLNVHALAHATIVVDKENDPYKGIYCVEMKGNCGGKDTAIIEYFDGTVLDVIKKNNGLYSKDELTSYSSRKLKSVGFIPDGIATLDYWELVDNYNKEQDLVSSTFANGSKEKFYEWVDKLFAKKNVKQLSKNNW